MKRRRPPVDRPTRVAMLGLRAPWGAEGGVEQAVGHLAPRLASTGLDITVYCRSKYNSFGTGMHDGVRLIDTPTVYRRSLEALVHTALTAPRASFSADLVHLHACGPALFSAVPALAGRATVVTLHGKDWEREKWGPAARAFLRAGAWMAGRAATEIIAVSQELADWCRTTGHVPVTHIPNGVAPHVDVGWDPLAFPALKPGGYLLFLGRLVPEKGLATLLEAVRLRGPGLHVVVTGGGSYSDAYVGTLRSTAGANVIFTGPRFGAEKNMLLTHARAFLLPSQVEGLPIALLEAMAAGLPTLASDIGPNLEALGDVAGWRLPVGDVPAWARALVQVEATERGTLRAYGDAGRRRVIDHFGWDRAVDATRAVYERALAR